ncbi:hypothetical protein DPMN_127646 [Dreissena polymorpha]|uniref:Uncharacterized protein n=1 Tax=Dreissena polymorpha TaxID=45954 RepID=A0A9D4H1K5_DREPO|nr:hypothetical protein DPMN_127646 [Dreissena polymorpha]
MSKTIYPLFFESSHVIQLTGTIFELDSRIKKTNVLSKFYENWAKNVTSTVFTCFHYIHIEKNAPPTGGHVFSPISTIFKLIRDINKTNFLTNFHDDWVKIVTSSVYKVSLKPNRENCHYIHIEKNAPPTGGHVFSPISTIFKLTKFHDDWAKIVTSRVFTRKTAPPTCGHVFQRIGTTFELNQDIIKINILTNVYKVFPFFYFIGTKLLTKFHEDRTRNMASRVYTSKLLRTDGIQRTKTGHKSSPEQSVILTNNLFSSFCGLKTVLLFPMTFSKLH